MYLGVFLGPLAEGPHQDSELIDFCLDQALEAAASGFSLITFGEQHFNNYEPYCNPFMMGSAIARHLKDACFGATVIPVPLHQPFRLAEQMALLDQLTKGQCVFGVSAGQPVGSSEHKNFGIDPHARQEVFDANMALLLNAFAHQPGDGPIVMDSPWGKGALDGRLMPSAWRRPHPFIALATNTESRIAKAGADGWPIYMAPCSAEQAQQRVQVYRAALVNSGHSDSVIQSCLQKSAITRQVFVAATDAQAWELVVAHTAGVTSLPGAEGSSPLTARDAQAAYQLNLNLLDVEHQPRLCQLQALQA